MTKELSKIIDYIRYVSPTVDIIRLNQILFYGDYISLESTGIPITWSKYHIINDVPYCSSILAEWAKPIDFTKAVTQLPTIQVGVANVLNQVIKEFKTIERSFNNDGINVFVSRICNINGRPCIDHEGMLFYITQEWDRRDRRTILKKYRESLVNKQYHCRGEDGILMSCTKYRAEQLSKYMKLLKFKTLKEYAEDDNYKRAVKRIIEIEKSSYKIGTKIKK